MENKIIRSFFAIPVSPDCTEKINIIEQKLKRVLPNCIRWVNSDNLHVTLKFLGEFDSNLISKLYKLLETSLSTISKFDLTFLNLGVFPNKQKPKVIWVGLDYPIELINIFRIIENVTTDLGYPKDMRGFSPHLTIGRVRIDAFDISGIGTTINNLRIGEICRSHADQVVFYQSTLTPGGPVYSELFQLPLNR